VPIQLAAIADDVTGGADLASVLRRSGARVVQTLGMASAPPPDVDAVVVSLKTRTAAVHAAVAASAAAAAYLRQAGASQLYFKYCSTFDSTDTGNIGPVIDELLDSSSAPFTVACPTYPAQGRTVYAGHLFVGGQLLSESPMRDHPLTPMTDANLVRVLGRQSRSRVGLIPLADVEAGPTAVVGRMDALMKEGYRVAIVDALFDRHLESIARATLALPLVTGGAALGGALAALRQSGRSSGFRPAPPQYLPSRVAVLSGSCSAATLTQLEQVRGLVPSRRLDPATLAADPDELSRIIDWASEQARRGDLLLYSTDRADAVRTVQARLGRDASASLVEAAFCRVAQALAADGVRAFVVAGGETSGAVLQALDIRMLEFGEEIAPGVPWTTSLDPAGYVFALKSGNFGGPDFFVRALGWRRRGEE
jgi:uncharacterized protein YgbK (DUF1537 family)